MRESRINIIGASGVGKTTLAKALAEKLNFPHFDTDHYYHLLTDPPFQKQRSSEDRLALVTKDLGGNSSWVLSGAVAGWQPEPKLDYSLVVLLYLSPEIRLERLRQRELRLYGSRILPGGDMESDHQFFMDWSSGYDSGMCEGTNTLPNHEAFVGRVTCPTIRIGNAITTEEQLRLVLDAINA